MPHIPNIIQPLPDELFGSYLSRISYGNGLTCGHFLSCYMNLPYNSNKKDSMFSHYKNMILPQIFGEEVHMDFRNLLQETSVLPGIWCFYTLNMQDRITHEIMGDTRLIYKPLSKKLDSINMCPMCKQEDQSKYGLIYPHTKHQLPNVKCCYKHKIAFENSNKSITDTDIKYAEFFADLQDLWINANYKDIQSIISSSLFEETRTNDDYVRVTEIIKESGYDSYYKDIYSFLKRMAPGSEYMDIPSLVATCCFLFDSAKELESQIHEKAKKNGASSNKMIIKRYHCERCSFDYYDTPHSAASGYLCPNCYSEQELLHSFVENTDGGKYHLTTGFAGMMQPLGVKCDQCGQISFFRARSFLFEGARCLCNYQHTDDDMRNMMPEGYELIQFKGMPTEMIRVKCLDCGHEFTAYYKKFLANPHCYTCSEYCTGSEGFSDLIFNLVGNEYTLHSPYISRTDKVTMYHEQCKGYFEIAPKHFLDGCRCPKCTVQLTKEQYTDYVSKLSSGQYQIIDFTSSNMVLIQDVNTKECQTLQRTKVLQELLRPTPSTILPHKMLDIMPECIYRKEDIVYSYITKNYTNSDQIHLQDLKDIIDMPYAHLKGAVATLVQKDKLTRISLGTYQLNE